MHRRFLEMGVGYVFLEFVGNYFERRLPVLVIGSWML